LTLHGLQQYYLKLEEKEKNRKLNDLLDNLEFNQVSFRDPGVPDKLTGRSASSSSLLPEPPSSTLCYKSATSLRSASTLLYPSPSVFLDSSSSRLSRSVY
jgi:hypothetical protein